jgi:hypothetical protein
MSLLMQDDSMSPATAALAISLGENSFPDRDTGHAEEHFPQSWQV